MHKSGTNGAVLKALKALCHKGLTGAYRLHIPCTKRIEKKIVHHVSRFNNIFPLGMDINVFCGADLFMSGEKRISWITEENNVIRSLFAHEM